MKPTFAWSFALGFVALVAGCGGEGSGATTGAPAGSTTAAVTASTTATATATATESATTTASAAPSDVPSATATATATASVAASGTPAASGTAVAGAKKFDCGEKGQKSCPMQGWMKSAMGSAVASGDGDRIARALSTIASKPVAGMGQWSAIAAAGAAKASAGDIDGAKQSCKQCHDLYKHKYQTTMRDRPW